MAKIDASEVSVDNVTIEDDGTGQLRQVPGTDGGGGGGGTALLTTYDDTGNTHVQGANVQAALDDVDSELITIKNDITALTPSTTNSIIFSPAGAWVSATDPAVTPVQKVVNGVTHQTAQFAPSVDSFIEWSFLLPPDYDGNGFEAEVTFFTESADTDDIIFSFEALSYTNAAAMSGTYGTAASKTRTNTTANTVQVTDTSGGIAITPSGNNSPGDFCQLKFGRDWGSGVGGLNSDVFVLFVKLTYTKA